MPEFPLFSDDEYPAYGAEALETFTAAIAGGASRDEAGMLMGESSIDRLVGRLADRAQEQGPLIAERRRAGVARVAEAWGDALDAYYTVTLAAAEVGSLCSRRAGEPAASADSVSDALGLLNTRACQTSFEVHALLAAGFPGGAYGRYRTLHELAVTAAVIAEYGRRPEHRDLAKRYLDHTHIEHYQQARAYQKSSRHLGWKPFSDRQMQKLKKEQERCVARYGPKYRQPYGWAEHLLGPDLTFAALEKKANKEVLRYLYVTGNHLVHASAHGLRLTLAPGGEPLSALEAAGPTDLGLAQPAMASLNALLDVTGGLVGHGRCSGELGIMANFLALDELRVRALRLFGQR